MGLGIFEDCREEGKEGRIRFIYTNYKGEVSERHVEIHELYFEKGNKWHGDAWILKGFDLSKEEVREFCLTDIVQFIK